MVKLHRVFESDLYLESKKDLDDLKSFLGDKLFDDYMKIRDRIPKDKNEFKDFSRLKKMDKKDIQDFVSSFQSKSDKRKRDKTDGAEKLYEDSDWIVYKITTYPAAQLYGKGTKWCITGRYPGHEERGQEYFDSYIEDNNLDGGYYFYLNKKDPSEKYCVLQTEDKDIHSVWNAEDTHIGSSYDDIDVELPEISEVNLHKSIESLMEAIENNDLEWVEDELESITFLNYRDDDGDSPLSLATTTDNIDIDIVKALVNKGADVNYTDDKGNSPLVYSVIEGNKEVVDYLLEHGADPNFKDNKGNTPLSIACIADNKDIFVSLLEHGANMDVTINTKDVKAQPLFLYALKNNKLDFAKLCLDNGYDINILIPSKYDKRSCLSNLSYCKDCLKAVKFLLDNGADPNIVDSDSFTPLFHAVYSENVPLIKLLLSSGADPNIKDKQGNTPLYYSTYNKDKINKDLIRVLIDGGARVSLEFLDTIDDFDLFKDLVDLSGLDVSEKKNNGSTLLHSASFHGDTDVVNYLLNKGVDVNINDKNGDTPLHLACLGRDLDTVKLLLSKGADPNVKNKYGDTPTFRLSHNEDSSLLFYKELLKHGVNFNSQDHDGETLLTFACLRPWLKNIKLIKFLLDNGADPSIKNKEGKSCFDTKDEEIKELLNTYKK